MVAGIDYHDIMGHRSLVKYAYITHTLGEVVLFSDLVGICEGFVHCQYEGIGSHWTFIMTNVAHGLAHDSLAELFVTIEEGVQYKVAVVEVPG